MFAYIRGKLMESTPTRAIIEANGVGYSLLIPASVFSKLPQIQNEVLLYTSFVVREMSQTLFGFLSPSERDLFETLMGMTGVGPKTALGIIGHLPLDQLHQVVVSNDILTLSKVPGIGKKTAERIIVEMRGKFKEIAYTPSEFAVDVTVSGVKDAMSALINLGYNQAAAQKALKRTLDELPKETDLPTLITSALKYI